MKKIIIFLLVLFYCITGMAQPVTQRGSATITVYDARSGATFNMFMPRYADTTSANTNLGIDSCGAIIYTYNDKAGWFRQCSPKKWVLFGSSGGNNNTDTIYTEIPIAVKIDSLGRHIIYFLRPNGLYGGGIVTVDSCMTLDITPPTIVVNYKQYTGLQTIGVVVQAADPSLPRIDRVVMDTSLNIIVIEGMPSATPVPPEYNSFSQVSLAEIPVGADITCLGNAEIIFDGVADFAGQWTITTAGTGVTSFVNTINPYHLTEASYTVTYSNGYQIIYTKPSGTDTVKATSVLKGFITVVGNFTNQIIGQWYNGSTPVSNQLLLNSYFNVNDSNNYQIFSPQLSAWSWPGGTVYNKLILSFGGSDNSGSNGVYLDWLQIQTGIGNAGNKQYQDSSSIVAGFLTDWYNGVPITRQAVGGGGSQGLQDVITVDNAFSKDDTIDINTHKLTFLNGNVGIGIEPDYFFQVNNGGRDYLYVNKDAGAENALLAINDDIGGSSLRLTSNPDDGYTFKNIASDGVNTVSITGYAGGDSIAHTAATHIFHGSIQYNSPVSGATTDSVLVENPTTHVIGWRNSSSFGSTVFAKNGLTKVVDSIKLGGNLNASTTINGLTSFPLTLQSAIPSGSGNATLNVNNTSATGGAILINSDGGTGLEVVTNTGYAASLSSNTGPGINIGSGTNTPIVLTSNPASTNTVTTLIDMGRFSTGTAANGIGGSILYTVETSTGGARESNTVVSKWTDATDATRTSEFSITGVNSTAILQILAIEGGGALKYTINVVSGTTNVLATNSSYIQVFSGSSASTWTLPAISGNTGLTFIIKNRGSASITLNSNAGANDIYSTSAVNTLTITAGTSVTVSNDGTYYSVY